MKTYVLDVQRSSVNDGPGIRTTVFLKGCPLQCQWCHNPESQSFDRQLSFNRSRCTGCGACVDVCPNGVHTVADGIHTVDYAKCTRCGDCVDACMNKALCICGKGMSPTEVFDIVEKDRAFYEATGGGVTLSGGEPLVHPEFCEELLSMCQQVGISTCMETSGFAPRGHLERLLPLTDLFLFDYKLTEVRDSVRYIGAGIGNARDNLEYICEKKVPVVLRCPIVPGVNDNDAHFEGIGRLLTEYEAIQKAELLPYHDFGISKGEATGQSTQRFTVPSQKQKDNWIGWFKDHGFENVALGE